MPIGGCSATTAANNSPIIDTIFKIIEEISYISANRPIPYIVTISLSSPANHS